MRAVCSHTRSTSCSRIAGNSGSVAMPAPMCSAMREIAGLEAHLPIQRQQMNRRIVHADADAGGVHLRE